MKFHARLISIAWATSAVIVMPTIALSQTGLGAGKKPTATTTTPKPTLAPEQGQKPKVAPPKPGLAGAGSDKPAAKQRP